MNDYLLSNLAAFIILKADKIRKKKLYVLFILSPNNTTRTLLKGSMLQASSVKTDIALLTTAPTANLMFIRSGMTGQQ